MGLSGTFHRGHESVQRCWMRANRSNSRYIYFWQDLIWRVAVFHNQLQWRILRRHKVEAGATTSVSHGNTGGRYEAEL
jgi:hypothetical protein